MQFIVLLFLFHFLVGFQKYFDAASQAMHPVVYLQLGAMALGYDWAMIDWKILSFGADVLHVDMAECSRVIRLPDCAST